MTNKKRVAILGSTGSIGRQALAVVGQHPEAFTAEALTAQDNAALLIEQAIAFRPNVVVIGNEAKYGEVADALQPYDVKVFAGAEAIGEVAAWSTVDVTLSALVGFAGLHPTLCALRANKPVALANKETLVAAGALVIETAMMHRTPLLPVDSEHSAIFQCLAGEQGEVEKLYLTASGGPFLHTPAAQLATVTKHEALRHPKWTMGAKITIDSATMMNKGLEVIEAHWLFGLPADRIEVLVHPHSIVHSMVQFTDGAVKAQLGVADMRLPIQYALSYPQRLPLDVARIDFAQAGTLTFLPPDRSKFPCLELAYEALRQGGNMPCAMNAANEAAVEAFLHDRIGFTDIPRLVEKAMQQTPFIATPTLADLQETDKRIRKKIEIDEKTILTTKLTINN
ncbi:MAG: 1-deoxy-D-xylulose-5-phosphate reductoisomerase [Prevotellaceae bacterium]|jgi:1-deoxy-D-xylulose-5-phosphate reductoisomerase|nr:1-deoxy-D-xylulose-5-phosphate reductoisomerase [Prevotellaceae bacterium]